MSQDQVSTFLVSSLNDMNALGEEFTKSYLRPLLDKKRSGRQDGTIIVSAYGPSSSGKTVLLESVAGALWDGGRELVARVRDSHISLDKFPSIAQVEGQTVRHTDLGYYWYNKTEYGKAKRIRCKDSLAKTAYAVSNDYGFLSRSSASLSSLDLIEHATLPVVNNAHTVILVGRPIAFLSSEFKYLHVLTRMMQPVSDVLSKEFSDLMRRTVHGRDKKALDQTRVVKVIRMSQDRAAQKLFKTFSRRAETLANG